MNKISSPADKQKFKNAIGEISASLTRIEAERDLIKEIVSGLSEDFEMEKKIIRRIARTYHKQNLNNELAEHEDFVQIYEDVIG